MVGMAASAKPILMAAPTAAADRQETLTMCFACRRLRQIVVPMSIRPRPSGHQPWLNYLKQKELSGSFSFRLLFAFWLIHEGNSTGEQLVSVLGLGQITEQLTRFSIRSGFGGEA